MKLILKHSLSFCIFLSFFSSIAANAYLTANVADTNNDFPYSGKLTIVSNTPTNNISSIDFCEDTENNLDDSLQEYISAHISFILTPFSVAQLTSPTVNVDLVFSRSAPLLQFICSYRI